MRGVLTSGREAPHHGEGDDGGLATAGAPASSSPVGAAFPIAGAGTLEVRQEGMKGHCCTGDLPFNRWFSPSHLPSTVPGSLRLKLSVQQTLQNAFYYSSARWCCSLQSNFIEARGGEGSCPDTSQLRPSVNLSATTDNFWCLFGFS